MSIIVALATSVAISAATRGHVSTQQQVSPAAPTRAAVCMWQVPGSLQWINLYALQRMSVSERDRNRVQPLYETVLTFGRYDSVSIDLAPGADIGTHSTAVLKRLQECRDGG